MPPLARWRSSSSCAAPDSLPFPKLRLPSTPRKMRVPEISSCLQQTSPASTRPFPWVRVLPDSRCCRSREANKMSASTPQHSLHLRLLGSHCSSTSYGLRDFLYRSNVPFEWIELTSDERARELAQVNDLHDHRLPVCLFPDGVRLDSPTIRQIAEKLGWFQKPSSAEYDLAILGAGPAGLSAAVYGASEGLKTLLIERSAVGGQAATSSRIENYLGFPQGVAGSELACRAREQALRFGAEILLLQEGVRADFGDGPGIGYLADGIRFAMRSSICASGMDYRRLNLWNEDRLRGRGVYYGAGASEAELCAHETVFVVGGGNSAGQAALHFCARARKVVILIRGEGLKETVSQYLVDRILAANNIEVLPH